MGSEVIFRIFLKKKTRRDSSYSGSIQFLRLPMNRILDFFLKLGRRHLLT